MSKRFPAILLLLAASFCFGLSGALAYDPEKEGWLLLVGVVGPEGDGDLDSALGSIRMVFDDANKGDGIFGRDLGVVKVEAKGDAGDVLRAVEGWLSRPLVAVLSFAGDGLNLKLAELLDGKGVPFIGVFSEKGEVLRRADGSLRPNAFSFLLGEDYLWRALHAYATFMGFRSFAVVYEILDQVMLDNALALSQALSSSSVLNAPLGVRGSRLVNFVPQVLQIQRGGFEAIGAFLGYRDIMKLSAAADELNLRIPILVGVKRVDDMPVGSYRRLEGSLWFDQLEPVGKLGDMVAFRTFYFVRNRTYPNDLRTAYAAFSSARWLVEGFKAGGGHSREALRRGLERVYDLDLFGVSFGVDASSHRPARRPVAVMRLEDGAYRWIDTIYVSSR